MKLSSSLRLSNSVRIVLLATCLLAPTVGLAGCASARLEPADSSQKVPNKPKAAAVATKTGIVVQAEADTWVGDERVRDEVTAMKVTLVNKGSQVVTVDYNAFELVAADGHVYRPVAPETIEIRGGTRSIGLPADTIITRTSDSSVNAPGRTESEKQQIRQRLIDQALDSGPLQAGQRTIGYVFFERVPASQDRITFKGKVMEGETGNVADEVAMPFQVRKDK